jgi:hypothetical protein
MSTESKPRPTSDEAILQERERSNEAVFRMFARWSDPGEESEQREALDELTRALDEDRPSSRKLYPERDDLLSERCGGRFVGLAGEE